MPVSRDAADALTKKIALILFTVIAVCFIAVWASKILIPFAFAMLFSFVLLPLADIMERKFKFHRLLSSAVSVILLLAIGSGILYLALSQLGVFADHLPEFKENYHQSHHNSKIGSLKLCTSERKNKKHILIVQLQKFHQPVH